MSGGWIGARRALVGWVARAALSAPVARRVVERLAGEVARVESELVATVAPDLVVRRGPFKGMRYPFAQACGSALVPKLIGSYEMELAGVVEECAGRDYSAVVDVGCAEGYYAVGFAMRMPGAVVHAFDIDPLAERLCAAMAEANGVAGRVRFHGGCGADSLLGLGCGGRTLVVSDCEGFELEIVRPDRVPTGCDVLVEVHNWLDPGIGDALERAMCGTHSMRRIAVQGRDASLYAELAGVGVMGRSVALDERRPSGMEWMYFEARETR